MAEGQNSPEEPLALAGPKKRIFGRAVGALQEIPLIAAWKKEREFKSLGKKTVKKLLTDIKTGGLAIPEGRNQKYWVWLGNDRRQGYVVTALIEPPKPWLDTTLHIEAADNNLLVNESSRSLTATMSPSRETASKIPPSDPKWQGDIMFEVTSSGQQISKEEQASFLRELLNATVDEKTTRSEHSKASPLASWVGGKELIRPTGLGSN